MPDIKLTFYVAALRNYMDWLAPLWLALPDEYKDDFYARGVAIDVAKDYGIEVNTKRYRGAEMTVVAGYPDLHRVAPSLAVLVNHGAGQKYNGDPKSVGHSSYSGGKDRHNVVMNICPSEQDAQVCRDAYPSQVSVAAGPYKLDPWLSGERKRSPSKVVFSFHADAYVCPETQSAMPHYRKELIKLMKNWPLGFPPPMGHCHPRSHASMAVFWSQLKVPFEPRFDRVLDQAAVYVCDTSSTLYEAAAVGIPVVVLDAPWYRKDVRHGLRFWDCADVGVRIGEPRYLSNAIRWALRDGPLVRRQRESIVEKVYSGLTDGHSTERAVKALMDLCDGRYESRNKSA